MIEAHKNSFHYRGKNNWKCAWIQLRLAAAEGCLKIAIRLAPNCLEGNNLIQNCVSYFQYALSLQLELNKENETHSN